MCISGVDLLHEILMTQDNLLNFNFIHGELINSIDPKVNENSFPYNTSPLISGGFLHTHSQTFTRSQQSTINSKKQRTRLFFKIIIIVFRGYPHSANANHEKCTQSDNSRKTLESKYRGKPQMMEGLTSGKARDKSE